MGAANFFPIYKIGSGCFVHGTASLGRKGLLEILILSAFCLAEPTEGGGSTGSRRANVGSKSTFRWGPGWSACR